jgi:hypothetical protein
MATRPAPYNRDGRLRIVNRPAPGNRNRVATRNSVAALRSEAAAKRPSLNPAAYGKTRQGNTDAITRFVLEENPIMSAAKGFQGLFNLGTAEYNPEGINYPTRMVPAGARGGGMPTGVAPGPIDSFAALGPAIGSLFNPRDRTAIEQRVYEEAKGNPKEVALGMGRLSERDKTEQSIQEKASEDAKNYSTLLSVLKQAGITSEEDLYRGAVMSPDGQVSLNPTVQAALGGIVNAGEAVRVFDAIGFGAGKALGAGVRLGAGAGRRSIAKGLDGLIPRIASAANNPTLINAGMDTVRAATAGAPMEQSVATGIASLVAGNKPISNVELRLTPEQHGLLVTEGLDAKAPRGGNRGLAATLASNVQSALRRPPAGSGGKRIPVDEMKVKFTAEDEVRLAKENPEIMNNNAEYIDLYRSSAQGTNKPGSIFVHAHPPGMNPSDVRNVLPDHITSGPLNDLESKVNATLRAEGRDPLTNYTDIVNEGIAMAKNGKFKEGTWNAKLAGMTLEEAQVYLGANGVKYW